MIGGRFSAVATGRDGVARVRDGLVNTHAAGRRAGPVWAWTLKYLVPVEFAAMFGWWMYQAATVYDPDGWWNPLRVYSVGTCVVQWGVALAVLAACNRRLAARSAADRATLAG